jgi:glycosyltransferase involved in cell wall biosynthesis
MPAPGYDGQLSILATTPWSIQLKILIVNTLFPPHKVGGAEKSVALLAEGLARSGDEVSVATLDEIDTPNLEVRSDGIRVHRLPLDNIYWPWGSHQHPSSARALLWHYHNSWNPKAAKRLGRVIDDEQPDVVHCNNLTGFSPSAWTAIKARGLPILQTLRDYWPLCVRAGLFKNGDVCTKRCTECQLLTRKTRSHSGMVDQLVSNSNFVIAAHHRHDYFPGVPARRIFNVVDLPSGPRVNPSQQGDPLMFGFIGRIEAEKGIEIVLDAVTRLNREDWRLRIAGVGVNEYVEGLRRRFPDHRIEWLGFASSADFYRSIDVALISSVWPEPLPRTLIESLGNGLGVICSDAGGIPEIADLGLHSLTYPAKDAVALAVAMRVALDNPEGWREGGLKDADALKVFSEGEVIAQYRQAYADALGGSVS